MIISTPCGYDVHIEPRLPRSTNLRDPTFRQLPISDQFVRVLRNAGLFDIWATRSAPSDATPRAGNDAQNSVITHADDALFRPTTTGNSDSTQPQARHSPREASTQNSAAALIRSRDSETPTSGAGAAIHDEARISFDDLACLPYEMKSHVLLHTMHSDSGASSLIACAEGSHGSTSIAALHLLNSPHNAPVGRAATALRFTQLANTQDLSDADFANAVREIVGRHRNIGMDLTAITDPQRRETLLAIVGGSRRLASVALSAGENSVGLDKIFNALHSLSNNGTPDIRVDLSGRSEVTGQTVGHLSAIRLTALALRGNNLSDHCLDHFEGDSVLKMLDIAGNNISIARAQALAEGNSFTVRY